MDNTRDQRLETRAKEISSLMSVRRKRDLTVKQAVKQTCGPEPKKSGYSSAGHPTASFLPKYGVRSPMIYQILETELDSLTNFNDLALCWMSIGSFLPCIVISILVDYGYATAPVPAFGQFLLYKASWCVAVLSVICFVSGAWALRSKKSLISRIKQETADFGSPP